MSDMSKRRTCGQGLVEFALVLPILVLIAFGIFEFSRFMFAYATFNNAVREGTRYAIVHGVNAFCPSGPVVGVDEHLNTCYDPTGVNVQNAVKRFAFTFATSSDLVVYPPVWSQNNNSRGSPVQVSATYTFRTILPLPIPPIPIAGSSTDVINY